MIKPEPSRKSASRPEGKPLTGWRDGCLAGWLVSHWLYAKEISAYNGRRRLPQAKVAHLSELQRQPEGWQEVLWEESWVCEEEQTSQRVDSHNKRLNRISAGEGAGKIEVPPEWCELWKLIVRRLQLRECPSSIVSSTIYTKGKSQLETSSYNCQGKEAAMNWKQDHEQELEVQTQCPGYRLEGRK